MCGIAGFIDFSSLQKEEAHVRLKKMTAALAHRGPDDENFYIDEFAALGHRRLSIIDVSSGQQPMTDAFHRYQIIFNGEIYNYRELKDVLIEKGYKFKTKSDTEVILNAYIEWGEASLKKLNGMFAFAIWDIKNRELFVARDRVGKKPFYYIWNGNQFAFSSEIKGLLAGEFSKKKIDPRALDCYFSFGYIPGPFSIFEDIEKLMPAHSLTINQKGIVKKRYWQLTYGHPINYSLEEAAEELETLLRKAVKCRLTSEVPLGAFLSSGIDSSLVVSFMAELMDKPVITNTIGFGNTDFSELPAARQIAAHLHTDHHEFIVRPEDWDSIYRLAHFFDEPFADSSAWPSWHVCEKAKQNVTVALSGDGGDEAFAGYTFRYLPHQLESAIRSGIPLGLRKIIFSKLGRIYPGSSRLPKYFRLKTIFENLSVSDARAFYNDLVWLRQDTRDCVYSKGFLTALNGFSPAQMVLPLYEKSPARDALSRAQHTDIQLYMTDDVLVKTDRMSMAHALEVRNPLLDYNILEFAATLPAHLKINKTKGKLLLRHLAGRRLPKSIPNLPKQGFSIPAALWLRNQLKANAYEIIFTSQIINTYLDQNRLKQIWQEHQTGWIDHHVFLWGLMMLGLWEKEYV